MISGIDFDYDIDVDIDVDAGIEGGNMDFQDVSNAEVNQQDVVGKRRKPLKWWQIFLIYFNFVGLPFMFTLTCWIFTWWFITVLTTSITYSYDSPFGFLIMILAFFPALIVTKIITTPFKNFFKNLNKDGDKAKEYVGRRGVMLSTISEERMGNAEVIIEGDSYNIYVKSLDGSVIAYHQEILIIKKSQDNNYFLVQTYN
jgi:membrane protein implicated in regulation of membrane protease activity